MAGGVVIFAAGNENSGQPGYPAAYEPCISVAAVSCTYEAAWYTNYGPTVDICAPGGGDAADFSRPIHYNEGYNLSTLPTDRRLVGNGRHLARIQGCTRIDELADFSGIGTPTIVYWSLIAVDVACCREKLLFELFVRESWCPELRNDQGRNTRYVGAGHRGPLHVAIPESLRDVVDQLR